MDEKKFEELLGKAFEVQNDKEISRQPQMKELSEAAPFTQKQLDDVKRMCKKEKKSVWKKYIGSVAAVILCVSVAGFGIMLTNPGMRATVGDNIVKFIEEGFNIDFTEAGDDRPVDISETVIGYIPKGFERIEERSEKTAESISYSYVNDKDEYIVIDILSSSDIELVTEDQHHELEPFYVDKYLAYISYSDTQHQGSIYFGNSSFTVAISGMTDRDELIKIAENIKIKE